MIKVPFASILLSLVAALSSCKKDPSVRTRQLETEVVRIQNTALQSLLQNDLKFVIDFVEQEQFFEALREDMKRCRNIEAELRKTPDSEVLRLEEITTEILQAISQREDRIQRRRETPSERHNTDPPQMIEALEETIKAFKEAGRDTAPVEQLLEQFKQKAESGAEPRATRTQAAPNSGRMPEPETDERSRKLPERSPRSGS